MTIDDFNIMQFIIPFKTSTTNAILPDQCLLEAGVFFLNSIVLSFSVEITGVAS
jgi:hypothetical protein